MPEEAAGARECDLGLQPQHDELLELQQRDLDQNRNADRRQNRLSPLGAPVHEHVVDEGLGKGREEQPRHHQAEPGQHDVDHAGA